MCGLSGYWKRNGSEEAGMRFQVGRMTDTLAHRGPDDAGLQVDLEAGLALGFRRLAIVDLSPEGHQPMNSETGRYVIVFNGEIYNFAELRKRLEPLGHKFRGHSDTEVMLAAIEEWGLEPATKQFVGMFAFVLWDRKARCLQLVRDRLGIKPLYYGWMANTFLFGSELKALRAHPDFRPEVDRGALSLFLRFKSVPAPYSIYKGVYQLPPGCILKVSAPDSQPPTPVPYWSAKEVAEQGAATPFSGTEEEAIEQLDGLLRESVRLRMVADVPLGAFLSGGIDSSMVVALMQAQSSQPVKTFSIGFEEAGYDEALHAKAVAKHLRTDHTELYVTPAEAQAVIPRLPEFYDEPFADSSQIPTFLISQLARSKVTVSLSGDGGDELFFGYPRYFAATAIWNKMRMVPAPMRQVLSRWVSIASGGTRHFFGRRLDVVSEILALPTKEALYQRFISDWRAPAEMIVGGHEPPTVLTKANLHARVPCFEQLMQYFDTVGYLPNDIFAKVDRASMAVSLEARVPLVDHRIVEFAWRLPMRLKVRHGHGKRILRKVLDKYVPHELIDRPKMGFGIPIGKWMRGPLRDWAETLLDERRLRNEGFFHPEPIREKWNEHIAGARNWEHSIWDILMFQTWLERWGKSGARQTSG